MAVDTPTLFDLCPGEWHRTRAALLLHPRPQVIIISEPSAEARLVAQRGSRYYIACALGHRPGMGDRRREEISTSVNAAVAGGRSDKFDVRRL